MIIDCHYIIEISEVLSTEFSALKKEVQYLQNREIEML